jgi:hypothetical protein
VPTLEAELARNVNAPTGKDRIRMTNEVRRHYRRAAFWNARFYANRNRHTECAFWLLQAQRWHDLIMRDRQTV